MKELVNFLQILIICFLVLLTTTNCDTIDTFLCGDFSEEELSFYNKLNNIANPFYKVSVDRCQRDELIIVSNNKNINYSKAVILLDTIWKYQSKYKLNYIEIRDSKSNFVTHLYMIEGKPVFLLSDCN